MDMGFISPLHISKLTSIHLFFSWTKPPGFRNPWREMGIFRELLANYNLDLSQAVVGLMAPFICRCGLVLELPMGHWFYPSTPDMLDSYVYLAEMRISEFESGC